jgi:lysophospholipase L1-like esterase
MRSEDFPARKSTPRERRILFVGDSVINGGSLIDQSALATELLRAKLADKLDRPITVGNISAGSWGPPNQLAYLNRFGFFDADVVVFVVSNHDYADVPTFAIDLGPDSPTRTPPLAIWEAATRYLPHYLHASSPATSQPPAPPSEDIRRASDAFAALLERVKAAGAVPIVALHRERDEPRNNEPVGLATFHALATNAGAAALDLGPFFAAGDYHDHIHLNARGQQALAEALLPIIVSHLTDTPTTNAQTTRKSVTSPD